MPTAWADGKPVVGGNLALSAAAADGQPRQIISIVYI